MYNKSLNSEYIADLQRTLTLATDKQIHPLYRKCVEKILKDDEVVCYEAQGSLAYCILTHIFSIYSGYIGKNIDENLSKKYNVYPYDNERIRREAKVLPKQDKYYQYEILRLMEAPLYPPITSDFVYSATKGFGGTFVHFHDLEEHERWLTLVRNKEWSRQ